MFTRRPPSSRAIAAAVAFVALLAAAPAAAAPRGAGRPAPAEPGAAPAPGQEVQSWALGPAGTSDDPDQPNNRPHLSYELDPGAVVEDAVTLYNYGNVPLNFEVYATDAFNNEQGDFDILPGDTAPDDLGTWITLPSRRITLAAGSQLRLPITVRVPDGARPGDHAGAIVAASKAVGTGPDGKAVDVDRRTGTRVYIRVAGPIEADLAVEHVKTTYEPSINPLGGTAEVTYTIRNRGNVRLAGTHQVEVSGPFGLFGRSKAAKDLPELLPGERHTVHERFSGVPAAVIEQAEVRLEPAAEGGGSPVPSSTRRGMAFAPPLTLLLLAVATWLALRARRAYRRHRQDDPGEADPERHRVEATVG